jgi:PAS domain S-box-containing protein
MRQPQKRKILLVEDEAIVALAKERLLERNGYLIVRARTGEEAVSIAVSDRSVDLVLMDIDLGEGIDGTEAARRILSRRELPVVFLTGHQEREMVDRVKGITRYGYVLKTAGEFVLLESITMAFELFEAHRRISENEHWLRTTIDALPDEFWALDRDRIYVMQNAESRRRVGPMVGKRAEAVDAPESTKSHWRRNEDRAFRGERVRTEHRYFSAGEERVGESSLVPLEMNGQITHIIGLTRDVTDLRRAEEYLRSRESFLNKLIETSPVGIVVLDTTGAIVFANDQAETILGLSRERMEDRLYDDPAWVATDLEGLPLAPEEYPFRRVMRSGKPINGVRHGIAWPTGEKRYLSVNAAPMLDDEGRIRRVVAAIHDITSEKESEERYRRLFDEAPVGIFRTHSSGKALDANPAMAWMVGCKTPEEGLAFFTDLGRQLYVDPRRRREFIRTIAETGSVEGFVYEARRRDGSTTWISMDARITDRYEDGSFVVSGYATTLPAPDEESGGPAPR